MDAELIRAQRQARADRKAARLRQWAESADKKAAEWKAKHEPYTTDWQFVTQPILVGHHSERRHRNLKARIAKQIEKHFMFSNHAEELRRRAKSIETNVRVAGDAERARREKRLYADKTYTKGSTLVDPVYRDGVIERVNKKTYTIRFASGMVTTRDNSHYK
jgi:Domain of unknown function (DUF3560)